MLPFFCFYPDYYMSQELEPIGTWKKRQNASIPKEDVCVCRFGLNFDAKQVIQLDKLGQRIWIIRPCPLFIFSNLKEWETPTLVSVGNLGFVGKKLGFEGPKQINLFNSLNPMKIALYYF